jgi:predicted 3-demethylubiquinone-9 3-methyltransferase (glyoxalase superfamily)
MQKITPNLWFDNNAEEAVNFYASVFEDTKIGKTSRYSDEVAAATGMPKGTVLTMEFELQGQKFLALNGGPIYKFTEAVSFVISCDAQEEIDRYWEKLSEGGEPGRCGWLKDKFGLSWQVVPSNMGELMNSTDKQKSARVMQALMQMNKLDIATLQQA